MLKKNITTLENEKCCIHTLTLSFATVTLTETNK